MIAPRVATGSYRVSANIQSSSAPRRSPRSARPGLILLSNEPAAVPMTGGSGAQFNATVTLPGYTHAPPGRTGQAAAWWPIGGDSVVVQFEEIGRAHV